MIRMTRARTVVQELHSRSDPAHPVPSIDGTLLQALFAARSDEVLFWALICAHHRGGDLGGAKEEQHSGLSLFVLRDPSDMH
jgi:hypothetical protein